MTNKPLEQHTAELGALVDMCLDPYKYSLDELARGCCRCDKPGNTLSKEHWYCEEHAPAQESERMGDDEYNRRQYERHGPDGGV